MAEKITTDKLSDYRRADETIPSSNRLWPLYGSGFENLGKEEKPIEVDMPEIGPDELLVRHDACGLCFSDIKVIKAGQTHPRIYREMSANPVVLGHEISMTIVKIGENLRDQYKVGDRYIIQADVFVNGVGYAYGYEIQGGLSQYNVIDQRVLNGDGGNYLLPVQPKTGYAESALTEPWACVIAAYQLKYRTGLKPKGTTWIIGTQAAGEGELVREEYTIGAGFDRMAAPSCLLLTNVPTKFAAWLKEQALMLGVETKDAPELSAPGRQALRRACPSARLAAQAR